MGFISYSLKFLQERMNLYESKYSQEAPENVVHEAKVLLKFLEDIKDEGYRKSYDFINEKTNAVNRLKFFILKNNDNPFSMEKFAAKCVSNYKNKECNLHEYLDFLKMQMNSNGCLLNNVPSVFYDILNYSQNIFKSANLNTAYCFLLRDTLLPYFAFEKWNVDHKFTAYPIFISRKYLSFFDNKNNDFDVYSEIQNIIFDALDKGFKNLNDVKLYVRSEIEYKCEFRKLINLLKNMLSSIKQENIMIIESGYIGTIPLLFSSLDDRVDFRLFTTIPYFYKIYKDKFFTYEFQKIRLFETIQCQDALFKISSIDNVGNINICETSDHSIKEQALAELRTWNKLVSTFN